MWRQRLQAKAIRERLLRDLELRPPEPAKREQDKPPDGPAIERIPAQRG
jgi:hypothetical protein